MPINSSRLLGGILGKRCGQFATVANETPYVSNIMKSQEKVLIPYPAIYQLPLWVILREEWELNRQIRVSCCPLNCYVLI